MRFMAEAWLRSNVQAPAPAAHRSAQGCAPAGDGCSAGLRCMLAIERRLQLPDRGLRRVLQVAQGDQRNAVAAVALGFKQVIATVDGLADRGLGLRLAGRW